MRNHKTHKGRKSRKRETEGAMFNRGILKTLDEATKREFGRHLYQLMAKKNISPSELAKACFGLTDDKRGFRAPAGRDRISKYLRGVSFPDNQTMAKLAAALDVDVSELLPPEVRTSMVMTQSNVDIKVHPDEPQACRFAFVIDCSTVWASKIAAQIPEQKALFNQLLASADAKERKSAR